MDFAKVQDGLYVMRAPALPELCLQAEQAFLGVLLTVPHQVLAALEAPRQYENETPLGYRRRNGGDDHKRYIQYAPQWALMPKVRTAANEWPLLQQFLDRAAVLWAAAETIGATVVSWIDRGLPGHGFRDVFMESGLLQGSSMRFAAYDEQFDTQCSIVAGAHKDKSAVTLNLFESAPGLEVLANHTFTSVGRMPGDIIVSFGILTELLTNGTIPALEHRVMSRGGSMRVPGVSRTSIMFFVDQLPGSMAIPGREKTRAPATLAA
jgi:isopenicillin N synthase-like dioxygenase